MMCWMVCRKVMVGVAVLFFAHSVWASAASIEIEQSSVVQSGAQKSMSEPLDLEKYEQAFWGLSDRDWALYQKIKPIAKQLSKTPVSSTPPEILGIFARNMEDRERYAKLFATKFVQYVDSSVVSMRLVRSELRKLNEGRTMFDYERLNQIRKDVIGVHDRVQFFTKVDCDDCHARLAQLINQVRYYKVKLDIFVVDDSSDEELQKYAALHLPKELIEKGFITLNRDATFVAKHKLSVPVSFISKNGAALEMHTMD